MKGYMPKQLIVVIVKINIRVEKESDG